MFSSLVAHIGVRVVRVIINRIIFGFDVFGFDSRHFGIGFVTLVARHSRKSMRILQKRKMIYALAKESHSERWSGKSRAWNEPQHVYINQHLHIDALEAVA